MSKQSFYSSKSICFFGSYAKDYARNVVLLDGLKSNKVKIIECRAEGFFFFRSIFLITRFIQIRNNFGTILVGFPGHFDMPLAFILAKIFQKKIIYDIFSSKYETYVLDRKYYSKQDLRSKIYYWLDKIDINLADLV